jgi:hypothetical protein
LAVVMSHLGLASALDLPRANGAYRKSGDYRGHFDDADSRLGRQAYKTEIDLFGYRFETPDPLLLDGRIKSDRVADTAVAPSANPWRGCSTVRPLASLKRLVVLPANDVTSDHKRIVASGNSACNSCLLSRYDVITIRTLIKVSSVLYSSLIWLQSETTELQPCRRLRIDERKP